MVTSNEQGKAEQRTMRRRRGTWTRRLLWALAIVLLIPVVGILILASLDWNRLRPWIAQESKERLGRELRIAGDLDVELLRACPSVRVEGVSFENAAWADPPQMVKIGALDGGLCLWPLLRGDLVLSHLRLRDADVRLAKSRDGVWNFRVTPGSGDAEEEPPRDQGEGPFEGLPEWHTIDVTNVSMRVETSPDAKPLVLQVDRFGSERPAERGALVVNARGRLQDMRFGLDADLDVPDVLTAESRIAAEARGFLAEVEMVADGWVADLSSLSPAEADVRVTGKNLSDITAALGIELAAQVPQFSVSAKVKRDGATLDAQDLVVKLGESDVSGSVQGSFAGRPTITAKLVSNLLRWDDFGPLLPEAAAEELPASRAAEAQAEDTDETAKIFSPDPLPLDVLAAVDADVDFEARKIEGRGKGAAVESAEIAVDLKGGHLKVHPAKIGFAGSSTELTLDVNGGRKPYRVAVDLAVEDLVLHEALAPYIPEGRIGKVKLEEFLTGKASASVEAHTSGESIKDFAANLTAAIGAIVEEGRIASVAVEGLGFDVTEIVGTLFADKQTLPLNCLLVELDVKDGVATASPVLVATPDSNVMVEGNVNLREERLNLTIHTMPKDTSIGSLNVPIDLKGTLAGPEISPRKSTLLAKAAAAVGLGATLSPLAAAVPLLEPGTERSGRCGDFVASLKEIAAEAEAH